jgi:hypothetical protein
MKLRCPAEAIAGKVRKSRIAKLNCSSCRDSAFSGEIVRLLVEILIVGGLIYLGWEQPFKERVDQVRARVTGKQAQVAPQEVVPGAPTPRPAPRVVPGIVREPTPPHGAWRLDPTHRSPLDPPVHDSPSPH